MNNKVQENTIAENPTQIQTRGLERRRKLRKTNKGRKLNTQKEEKWKKHIRKLMEKRKRRT